MAPEGWIGMAVSVFGGGVAVAYPQHRWVGGLMMVAGVLCFIPAMDLGLWPSIQLALWVIAIAGFILLKTRYRFITRSSLAAMQDRIAAAEDAAITGVRISIASEQDRIRELLAQNKALKEQLGLAHDAQQAGRREDQQQKERIKNLADDAKRLEKVLLEISSKILKSVPLPAPDQNAVKNIMSQLEWERSVDVFIHSDIDLTIVDQIRHIHARFIEHNLRDGRLESMGASGLSPSRIKGAADALGELAARLGERL